MNHIHDMIKTHPQPGQISHDVLEQCIRACMDCAQTCMSCADACLSEKDVRNLVACIRLNLDCADVCETTGRLLSRQSARDPSLLRHQLEACAAACRTCGDECQHHASHMEHCRVCADACRTCEAACRAVLEALGR
jgi:hypothetical protein